MYFTHSSTSSIDFNRTNYTLHKMYTLAKETTLTNIRSSKLVLLLKSEYIEVAIFSDTG